MIIFSSAIAGEAGHDLFCVLTAYNSGIHGEGIADNLKYSIPNNCCCCWLHIEH